MRNKFDNQNKNQNNINSKISMFETQNKPNQPINKNQNKINNQSKNPNNTNTINSTLQGKNQPNQPVNKIQNNFNNLIYIFPI